MGVVDVDTVNLGVVNTEEEAGADPTLEGAVETMAETISHHLIGIGSWAEIMQTLSHRIITETTKVLAGTIAGPKTKPIIVMILHRTTTTEINNRVSVKYFPVFRRTVH